MVYWTIRNTREALRGSVDAAADDDHVGVLRIARASFHYLVEREAGEMRLSYGARATRKISPKCAA